MYGGGKKSSGGVYVLRIGLGTRLETINDFSRWVMDLDWRGQTCDSRQEAGGI